MKRNNKIKIAYDKDSGKVFDVICEFTSGEKAFAAKELYASEMWEEKELKLKAKFYPSFNVKNLCCFECDQLLQITNRGGNVYLKHKSGSDDCDLKSINPNELEELYRVYQIKESDKHRTLKHEIGSYLKNINGVQNVIIDDKFLFNELGRRKPDVLCSYKGAILVFEIQLSKISLRYLINRTKFYKKKYKGKDVFLIWVLDENNIKAVKELSNEGGAIRTQTIIEQSSMAMHIKYLNQYHNFFQFEPDKNGAYKFTCLYKHPFIHKDSLSIHVKFQKEFIELGDLQFDFDNKVVYYRDTEHLKESLYYDLNILKEQRELEYRQEYEEKEKRKKLQIEKERLNVIRAEKFDLFKRNIIRIYNLLNSIISLKLESQSHFAKKNNLLEEIKNINIDTCQDLIISRLSAKEISYYYDLEMPLELYRLISPDLKTLDLYNLTQSLQKCLYNKEYTHNKDLINRINNLEIKEINGVNYSVVNKKYYPYLFNKEQNREKMFYYNKSEYNQINTLFGFNLSPLLYYDRGDNVDHVYLFDFTNITNRIISYLSKYETTIHQIEYEIEEAKKRLPIILKEKIEEITTSLKYEICTLNRRSDFLRDLQRKYENSFAGCKKEYRCAYFDSNHKTCLKRNYLNPNNCVLSNMKTDLNEIKRKGFCQYYRMYSDKENIDDFILNN